MADEKTPFSFDANDYGWMAAGSGVAGIIGGISEGRLQRSKLKLKKAALDAQTSLNKLSTQFQIDDIFLVRDKQISQLKRHSEQTIAEQRGRYAAQNVDLSSGSVLDVQTDTLGLAAEQEAAIRNNAYRQATGLKMQSIYDEITVDLASFEIESARRDSILSGGFRGLTQGLQVASAFQGLGAEKKKTKGLTSTRIK